MTLAIGDRAPAFSLTDQNGKTHTLADYAGSWLVLYFYPKALTPGCTTQACAIRDTAAVFKKRHAVVVGISADKTALLKKFEEKEQLTFTLLGDPEKTMIDAYGMWQEKSMYGKKYMGINRGTVIVDPQGVVRHIIAKASPKTHADDVLKWLDSHAQAAA